MYKAIDLNPPSDVRCHGYDGVAEAVTYLACMDIVLDEYRRLKENNFDRPDSYNCASAKVFLRRNDNPMNCTSIHPEKLIASLKNKANTIFQEEKERKK